MTRLDLLHDQLATPDLPLLIQRSRIELNMAFRYLNPNQLSRRTSKRARQLDSAIKQQISTLAMNPPPRKPGTYCVWRLNGYAT
ncbi:MAG: hypothetical protein H6R07_866 [Proteobacteria bacterium]|nr:hypothetical protein [Pseudomonadota bacterium]